MEFKQKKQVYFCIVCGGIFILLGILFNEQFLAELVTHDGTFESYSLRIRIAAFEIFLVSIGGAFITLRHRIITLHARAVICVLSGLSLIALGILLNEWVVARVFGFYGSIAILWTWISNIIMILLGRLFIISQTAVVENSFLYLLKKMLLRYYGLIWVLCGIIIIELFSYGYFLYVIPAELRWSVYFVISGKAEIQPFIKPYLWSNYQPNPLSSYVNDFGWRYGGGPKGERFRILCLGGSTTWTDRASAPGQSYPAQLEKYLQHLHYDVDVVNGGAPFYSSAELIGVLAFRGLYTESDLVLIHTGGNDIFPLMTPREYKPDYTHWRTVEDGYDKLSRNDLFRVAWNVPSWTVRILAITLLKPDALMRGMLSKELTSATDILLSNNDFSHRQPIGLVRNLRTLITISRAHRMKAVTVLCNWNSSRLHRSLIPSLAHNPQKYQEVRKRMDLAIAMSNEAIQTVSDEMRVPVIPFNTFIPTSEDFWQDECHLNDDGAREKAVFIGNWLVENGILDDVAKNEQ